jgi:hypothetical protein
MGNALDGPIAISRLLTPDKKVNEEHYAGVSIRDYLTDDEYRELQNRLAAAPEHGDVIPGIGGFRKLAAGRPTTWQRTKKRSAKLQEQGKSRR